MFTGLVEEIGVVERVRKEQGGSRLGIRARTVLEGTRLGDSIAVNGACLTVVELGSVGFAVDCMRETLERSTLGRLSIGDRVNLERSLAWGGRLGGHLVLGHVDGVAEITVVRPEGIGVDLTFSLPEEIRGYVAFKGSIALDGISLTVKSLTRDAFTVGVIPHTMRETTLGSAHKSQLVNVEVDVLARYVQSALKAQAESFGQGSAGARGLTEEFLRDQGFV